MKKFFMVPEVDAWLVQLPTEPWLESQVEAAAHSADPLARLCAVALWARFWVPVGREAKKALLTNLLKGGNTPVRDLLLVQVSTLSADLLAWVERQALNDADRLHDDLEQAPRFLFDLDDPPADRQGYADWLREQRDDLESVLEVLEAGQKGGVLRVALESLDTATRDKTLLLDEAGSHLPPRLEAIAWIQPDAWWGVQPDD